MPVTVDIGWQHTNIHYARALIVVCPMELDVLCKPRNEHQVRTDVS